VLWWWSGPQPATQNVKITSNGKSHLSILSLRCLFDCLADMLAPR
jgi:hypothetical protein